MALQPTIGRINPDSERAAWWREIFGGLEVPLRGPVPELCNLPDGQGGMEPQKVYYVDIDKLAPEQIEKIATFAAEKFGVPVDAVWEDIDKQGIPVKAEDVSVSFDARMLL